MVQQLSGTSGLRMDYELGLREGGEKGVGRGRERGREFRMFLIS